MFFFACEVILESMNTEPSDTAAACVLLIGGTDPTGGAGLAADVQAALDHAVHPATVASMITVQDDDAFFRFEQTPPELIIEQIRCAVLQRPVKAVKTGALGSTEAVEAVCNAMEDLGLHNIVVDPVLKSTSGGGLTDDAAVGMMIKRLFPLAALITPNVSEAQTLSKVKISSIDDARTAAAKIISTGAPGVLVKGIVDGDSVADVLVSDKGDAVFFNPLISPPPPVRGTGCRLATAAAATLAGGEGIRLSAARGIRYVQKILKQHHGKETKKK